MPTFTESDILGSLERTRSAGGLYGIGNIGLASSYLRDIQPCLAGAGLCPTKVFNLASPDAWTKELAEAGSRLTYCGEAADSLDDLLKSISEGTGITAGAVLEYDCILSSRRKDRDGDILEQAGGLEIDPKMPLLWQHIQVQPIGKLVKVLSQDENFSRCKFAIADTELGRDAAKLTKFGAMRKSHGFRPIEASPVEVVKGADGKEMVRGWHIKRASCFEGSQVSVPANTDGQISAVYEYEKVFSQQLDGVRAAYGRGLLHSPMVKSWAGKLYDGRPAVAAVGVDISTLEVKSGGQVAAVYDPISGRWRNPVTKQFVSGADSGAGAGLTGRAGNDKSADSLFSGTAKTTSDAGQAGGDENKGKACPKCGPVGTLDSTGTCPNCGHMVNQEGKSADDLILKAGRVLSAASLAKVKAALAALEDLVATATADAEVVGETGGKSVNHSAGQAALNTKALGEVTTAALTEKGFMSDEMPGSYEWVIDKLRLTAKDYIRARNYEASDRTYVQMVATYTDRAIFCLYNYDSNKQPCFQVGWKLSNNHPQWDGDVTEVVIQPQVITKAVAAEKAKSGDMPIVDMARRLAAKALNADGDEGQVALDALESLTGVSEMLRGQRQSREFAAVGF